MRTNRDINVKQPNEKKINCGYRHRVSIEVEVF